MTFWSVRQSGALTGNSPQQEQQLKVVLLDAFGVNSEIILLDKSLPTLGTQVGLGQLHPTWRAILKGSSGCLAVLKGFVTDTEERFLSKNVFACEVCN